jgi:transcription termination factor Rho
MPVLDRSELEASPLADLHAIADQIGLEGFRRLRKADLIDAILGSPGSGDADGAGDAAANDGDDAEEPASRGRGRLRRRRGRSRAEADDGAEDMGTAAEDEDEDDEDDAPTSEEEPQRRPARSGGRGRARAAAVENERDAEGRVAEGVVDVLGNGSAFLRVQPPEPSDEDVYISAAQVRRCELVSGDRVTGPVRTPRRSERYPSLVRVDTINGEPADSVSDGSRYDDLPVAWPAERLALGSRDRTLEAIEWLAPFGLGSRVVLVGGRMAGKTRTLRQIHDALAGREELTLTVVLVGARPEELADWSSDERQPTASLSFAASADAQAQAVERALDAARRIAARGGNAVVLIDSLDGLSAAAAGKALAAARNLKEGGSLTIVATASEPLGGETTVIALDPNLTTTGREPVLDLLASGTERVELLVGDDGAQAIARARLAAIEQR